MKKILIVEDDQNISRGLAIRLKYAGYQVSVAPDALTGLEIALQKTPDLVILDISLPAGSGFNVGERIQALLPSATPLIFLTASQKPGLREEARKMGAVAFFQKPYDAGALLEAVKVALDGGRVSQEAEVYAL